MDDCFFIFVLHNCRELSREELLTKLKRSETEKKNMGEMLVRLNKKVSQYIERDAVEIDKETSNIVGETIENVDSPFDHDSPQHLLWEQQKLKNSFGQRRDAMASTYNKVVVSVFT